MTTLEHEARDAVLFSIASLPESDDTVQVRIKLTTRQATWLRKHNIGPTKMRELITGATLHAGETLERIRVTSLARAEVKAALNTNGIALKGDTFLAYTDEGIKIAFAKRRLAQADLPGDVRAAVNNLLTLLSLSPNERVGDSFTNVRFTREGREALNAFASDVGVTTTRVTRWLLAEALHAEGYKKDVPFSRVGEAGALPMTPSPLNVTALAARCADALRDAGIEVPTADVLANDTVRVPVLA